MKIRGLIVASVVFLALGGTLYWSNHRKPSEDTAKASADTPPSILKLDQSAITRLEVTKKDAAPVVLAKSASGDWQITEPKPLKADDSAVSGVLSTVSSLNSERLVEEKAVDLKPYGLQSPAVQVGITGKDNKTQKLLIGDDTPTGGAVYAKLDGDARVYTMSSFGKTSVDKGLNDLRDKHLLAVSSDKISRIELIRKNQDIEFGRNKDEWQILKPKPLRADSLQVDDVARKLSDARMDIGGSESPKDLDSAFAKASPFVSAKVTDQSGTQELQIRKSKDAYYAKSSTVEGVYKVAADLGEGLDKGLDDFRNKKLFDFGFNDPNKIEIHDGAKAYFLARNGEDWWSNGKKMDANSAQTLVSRLRDLSADKFPDSGFANPAIELTVTSDDGKKTEKVSIAKSGDSYIGKRENEPALYHLTSNLIDDLRKSAEEVKPAAAALAK